MDQICGVDDSARSIPLTITSCDATAEKSVEPSIAGCVNVSCSCPGGGTGCCKNSSCCASASASASAARRDAVGRTLVSGSFSVTGSPTQSNDSFSVVNTHGPKDRCTPILIDVNGKGLKLTDTSDGVDFDFFGTGTKIRIPWPAKDSGNAWLVLNRNGNGTIDNSSEMFGNLTPQPPSENPNGFLALAQYDCPENGGNRDGIIDSRDQVFTSLRLWVDRNHNGISEPDELFTLDQFGIEAVDLTYWQTHVTDPEGNVFRLRSTITVRPGSKASNSDFDVILVNTSRQ